MTHSVVVENLSKRYEIGELHRNKSLQETLIGLLKHPLSRNQKEVIWALKDVSFKIKDGEVLGIIGRNGAGKSTLLKVLAKITYPTSGTTNVSGRIASLLEVGTGFHEELTGRENIYLNGSILGMTKKEINERLDAIVAFSGVDRFIETPVKRYSSGMRLRLGFAVAAYLQADVLLVDEILAVGDAGFQKKCLNKMGDLSGVGRTVIFVSHNMAAVENLCSRVIWIDNGQVRQDGEPREVIKNYMYTFAQVVESCSDLRNIETRNGNGDIRYTGMEFLDSHRQPKTIIHSGDSLTVRLKYHAERPVTSPHFAIQVYTERGTLVTSTGTWSTGVEIPFLPKGDGYIDVEIDFLNMMPARYYMSLTVASLDTIYDFLEGCISFDVEASDFYGSGKGIEGRLGIIFLPCRWKPNRLWSQNHARLDDDKRC